MWPAGAWRALPLPQATYSQVRLVHILLPLSCGPCGRKACACQTSPLHHPPPTHTRTPPHPVWPAARPLGASARHHPAIYLTALRQLADNRDADPDLDPNDPAHPSSPVAAFFASGAPAVPPPDAAWGVVHATGYKDGSARLWDMATGCPRLLAVAATPEADWLPPARAVSCVLLVWQAGLLVVGHQKGEVREDGGGGAAPEGRSA